MKNETTIYGRRLFIELAIISVFFAISFLFPMCTFFYLGKGEEMIEKPQYAKTFQVVLVYFPYYLMVLFALLLKRKVILIIITILVAILTLTTIFLILLGFGWWGASPFHPKLSFGFLLINLLLLVLIVRSFMWIGKLSKTKNTITKVFEWGSIIFPALMICLYLRSYFIAKNEPIMRSDWVMKTKNGRIRRVESWDYIEGYHAMISKHFSKPESDSLKETFVLDSVSFMFFDDKSNVKKNFSVKAKNGNLDIEEILERYE